MEYLVFYLIAIAAIAERAQPSPLFFPFNYLHHGQQAVPHVQHNGFLADTHEVAAAKNAHLAAVAAHGHHEYPTHHHHDEHEVVPSVHHSGFLADTHEVAAAKNAHLAAVAAHEHHQYPVHHHHHEHEYPTHHHHEHEVVPSVHHSGFLADTHEVAAAKNAHLEAVAAHGHLEYPDHHLQYPVEHDHQVHKYETHAPIQVLPVHHGSHEYVQKYHGPIAVPVVLHNGHLADTPEVALAKSHHLGAVAQAKADQYYSGHQEYGYGGSYGYSGSHHGYGIPVVLPNGHIADTHEVAAAKSAHLLAVAKAKADKYYSGHGEGYGYGGGYGYSGSYHGYGIPVVLPDGHLADTHEVAAAKAAHLSAVAHAKAEQAHSHYDHDELHDQVEHHEPLTYFVPHVKSHPQSYANVWLVE